MKQKTQGTTDRYLVSFGDLFALLSFVFLFLYVISTVQNGVISISSRFAQEKERTEFQRKLNETIKAYEERLHAYEIEKEEYIAKHGTAREVEVYGEVLRKLYLLRDDAQNKNRRHLEIARKYDERKQDLDRYQQLIADIAKANMVSKSQMLKESAERAQSEKQLRTYQASFDERLTKASQAHKKQLEKEYSQTLDKERAELKREKILLRDEYREKVGAIKEQYREKLQTTDKTNKSKLDEIKQKYQREISSTKKRYKEKVDAVSTELKEVNTQLSESRAEKDKLKKEKARALASVDKLKTDYEAVKDRRARIRADIAEKLKSAFEKSGVPAEVDARTGEVTISFAESYFDYDSFELKSEMKDAIRKVVPVYAKTVLGDKNTKKLVASLEVVGFASPTYLGKYVEPGRLDWTGSRGVNYNMDLSYNRAKAIFQYIFDREQLKFGHQASMLKLTKVSGVSYLKSEPPRKPAAADTKTSPEARDFCSLYDCAAWQKVILKFNLKETP